MTQFPRGLYETLVTDLLAGRLDASGLREQIAFEELRTAEAADRIAWHIAKVVERALEAFPDEDRVAVGAQLARDLVTRIGGSTKTKELLPEQPSEPLRLLRSVRQRRPDGLLEDIDQPLIPLLDTALLTNAPGEPGVGHQIRAEIASADRIDVVMAFIRVSGINPFRELLRRHVGAGRTLRVLTTTYTGSTEQKALEMLVDLGAQVRVSYDTSGTRLHAKSWLLHRASGFSTAYVGSSNLTHSAQITGLEWNVRISGARNGPVIEKIAAVFDSYWEQPDFEEFDAGRFKEATKRGGPESNFQLSPIEIRLEPFQERLLEEIDLAREQGHHRNLLVSATGTGKTVMAACDYARLRSRLPRARLLFVAHRKEILEQSRATFRHAIRDSSFGEMWVDGSRPTDFEHVFASIQSLSASGLEALSPDHFDVVIVDEFHHAAAATYERLLLKVAPVELLGLTATPERSDGVSVLHWFDGRIAAELRLWDAIDQHRLTPFAYYGIADDLDLRDIPWKRGTGYAVEELTSLITGTDIWARRVLSEFNGHVGSIKQTRALGFCVSVPHAYYMARVFRDLGVPSVAVSASSTEEERASALNDLRGGRINVVFSVDLFNEGIDVPLVDTLLMLRPTESPLIFLQQLGRGLRKAPGKSICTVLDFVGQHRKEFRYDRRFRALLGGSRQSVKRQVEQGFPFLPAGCHMELDRVASERVLESIKRAVPTRWAEKVVELRALAAERPGISLAEYLLETGLELDDLYRDHSWSELRAAAGLENKPAGPHEQILRRGLGRLLHVDDIGRIGSWKAWIARERPLTDGVSEAEVRLFKMLLSQLLASVAEATTLGGGAEMLWAHPQVRSELSELLDVLSERMTHLTVELQEPKEVPLRVRARYTRHEILAATGVTTGIKTRAWREGVYHAKELKADLFAFTLDKTTGQFSPTTRYKDYAISRDLIHWESQSTVREGSHTGLRYQEHAARGSHVLLFARLTSEDTAFYFLGPATYVSHKGELPMAITWRLHHSLPGDLFAAFAAAVA